MHFLVRPRERRSPGSTRARSSPRRLDLPPLTEQTRLEAREIIARYPVARSALLPMLHLVQSVQGYVSPEGVTLLRRGARPDQGRGRRGRDVLHDVQAPSDRPAPGQRLHQHAVQRARRPADHGRAQRRPRRPPRRDDRRRLDHPRARRVPGRLRLRAGRHRRLRVLRPAGRRERPRAGRGPAPRREAAAHPRRPAHRLQGHLPAAGRLLPVRGRRRRTAPPSTRPARSARRCRPAAGRGARASRRRRCPGGRATSSSGAPAAEAAGVESAKRGAPEPAGRRTGRRPHRHRHPCGDRAGHVRPGARDAQPDPPRAERPDHASHSRAHHPLGRRPVLAAGHLRAARGLLRPADGAADDARRAGHAGQGLRPARPRRRRLPDRHEVELHPAAQAGGDARPVPRRCPSTSWSTPTRASRAPARTCR